MKKAFYDLCEKARQAANDQKVGETVGFLTEAHIIAKEESRIARARFEPTVLHTYTDTLRGTAIMCAHHLGFGGPPSWDDLFGFTGWTSMARVTHHRSSLDYRWKYSEYPVSYLPFAWPRMNPGSL